MSHAVTEVSSPPQLIALDLDRPQQTLSSPVQRQGVGLHSGKITAVKLTPAEPDQGRWFVRTDLPGQPAIAARPAAVQQTLLSTELIEGNASVRTVEHLMAALTGLGIDNVRIEVDGPEMPLLDGSAKEWAEAILEGGVVIQSAAKRAFQVTTPITIYDGDAFVSVLPSPVPRFTYGIEFEEPAIGNQWHSWVWQREGADFIQNIAPARTFGLAHQVDYLRSQGLIKGGSLENALVCSQEGWVNPPLRFDNEPARHKLLDLIGDISLLGRLPLAHILAFKASHRLHVQMANTLQSALPAQP